MPENRKRGIIQINFVQRSEVKRHTQIKTQYPLIFTTVRNSGNVLKNKLSKYLTSKKNKPSYITINRNALLICSTRIVVYALNSFKLYRTWTNFRLKKETLALVSKLIRPSQRGAGERHDRKRSFLCGGSEHLFQRNWSRYYSGTDTKRSNNWKKLLVSNLNNCRGVKESDYSTCSLLSLKSNSFPVGVSDSVAKIMEVWYTVNQY